MDKYQPFLKGYTMAANEIKRLVDDYLDDQLDAKTFQKIIFYWIENCSDKIFLDVDKRTFPAITIRIVGKRRLDYFLSLVDTKKIS